VRLDFIAEENLYFNQVILRGLVEPPSEASAAAAMQIQLGDVYRKEKLDAAVLRLRDILQEEGLYQAKVTTEVQANAETHQDRWDCTCDAGSESASFCSAIDEQYGISGCTDCGAAENEDGNGDYERANPKRNREDPEIFGEEGPFERAAAVRRESMTRRRIACR